MGRHDHMGTVGGNRHGPHLVVGGVTRGGVGPGRPGLPVVGGIGRVGCHRSAGPHPHHVVHVQLGEVEAVGIPEMGVAVHVAGGLGEVGIPHTGDISQGAEEGPGHGGCVEEQDRGLLNAVVREGPGDARRLGRGFDIRRGPEASPRRIDGVVGIEGVDPDAVHVPGAPVVGGAKAGPSYPIVVVVGVGARIPTVLHVCNDVPGSPAVGGLESLVGPAPPIHGGDHRVVRVLGVHADPAVTAAAAPGTVRGGHIGPGQRAGVELPYLAGSVIVAVVVAHPKVPVGPQGALDGDHVGRPARNNGPTGPAVRGTINVAVAGTGRFDPHVNRRRGRARSAVGVEEDPGKPVARVAVHREGGHLGPTGGRVGALPKPVVPRPKE